MFDDGDERALNSVGYFLQQSAELFLQHFLETESIGYPFTHDIDILISLVDEAETSIELTGSFREVASDLTKWEANVRKRKSYQAPKRKVFDALDVVQNMFTINGIDCNLVNVLKYCADHVVTSQKV